MRRDLQVQHMIDFRWVHLLGGSLHIGSMCQGWWSAALASSLALSLQAELPPACRSADEHKEDTAWSLMLSNGIIKTYDAAGRVTEVGWKRTTRHRHLT